MNFGNQKKQRFNEPAVGHAGLNKDGLATPPGAGFNHPSIRTVPMKGLRSFADASFGKMFAAAPCLGKPKQWLGAKSPFGLALPSAQPSAITMYAPRGVCLDGDRLLVSDSGNHRVLIWNTLPESDQTPADIVLGQRDFESEGPAAGGRGPENGFHLPTGITVIGQKLLVADAWHHRVLVWNQVPTASDTPPDYAIGQSDLSQVVENRGATTSANGLYWPYGIGWKNNRLLVADTGNRRVLIWNSLPDRDQPADAILGQPDAESNDENRGGPIDRDSFRWPHDFAFAGDQLFVADAGNHRILGWNPIPASDIPADCVIGQRDFQSAYELPYDAQGPSRLRFPYAIDCDGGVLAVADTANNRILFWQIPISRTVSPAAFDVVGQIDFDSNGENHWQSVSESTLCWPYGISFRDGLLAVADSGNNRVMIWDCRDIIQFARSNTPSG